LKINPKIPTWHAHKTGTISACLIAKNETKLLPRCIKSLSGLVDEIILVDTGSTDNTPQLARQLGCKVYHHDWEDDFAKARNYGLTKATMDWILIVDPDEIIAQQDHFKIKRLTSQFEFKSFQIVTRNYGRSQTEQGFTPCQGVYKEEQGWPGYVLSNKTRFFLNNIGIKFYGCYHEMVDWYIVTNKIKAASTQIPIHHYSHEISQKSVEEKRNFYLRLAYKKVRENPQDDQAWWELGVTETIAGFPYKAIQSMKMSLRKGYTQYKRLFTLSKLYKQTNDHEKYNFCFEKGICKLYPALTHLEPNKKDFSSLNTP